MLLRFQVLSALFLLSLKLSILERDGQSGQLYQEEEAVDEDYSASGYGPWFPYEINEDPAM